VLSQENKTEAVHITNISNLESRNLLILATVRAMFNFLEYPFQTWLYTPKFQGSPHDYHPPHACPWSLILITLRRRWTGCRFCDGDGRTDAIPKLPTTIQIFLDISLYSSAFVNGILELRM
jgi:hypothetical protein